jgi:hypothetical protein
MELPDIIGIGWSPSNACVDYPTRRAAMGKDIAKITPFNGIRIIFQSVQPRCYGFRWECFSKLFCGGSELY